MREEEQNREGKKVVKKEPCRRWWVERGLRPRRKDRPHGGGKEGDSKEDQKRRDSSGFCDGLKPAVQ